MGLSFRSARIRYYIVDSNTPQSVWSSSIWLYVVLAPLHVTKKNSWRWHQKQLYQMQNIYMYLHHLKHAQHFETGLYYALKGFQNIYNSILVSHIIICKMKLTKHDLIKSKCVTLLSNQSVISMTWDYYIYSSLRYHRNSKICPLTSGIA